MNRWFRLPAALLLGAGLFACAAPPPPVPPTIAKVAITAGAVINPGPDGAAAPVVLRIYQLGSAAAFNGAEFFALYNADAATLGTDLVKREDVPLNPGGTATLTLTPLDTVKSIGVFAGLRGFQTAAWHASVDIPAHQTTDVTVTLGRGGLALKATPVPAPAKP